MRHVGISKDTRRYRGIQEDTQIRNKEVGKRQEDKDYDERGLSGEWLALDFFLQVSTDAFLRKTNPLMCFPSRDTNYILF